MASLTPRIDRLQKNYLINGDMRISQRGTSFASIATGTYFIDRFEYTKAGAMVHTASRDTDVPTAAQAGYLFQNSLRLNLTTPDTTIASTDLCLIRQKVEGYNWANLAQKPFTLSFWVKATLPGTYCIAVNNTGVDRSFVAEYSIDAANTWEKKVINITASPSDGTWNYSTGIGLYVHWTVAAGTDFQAGTGSWTTGNKLSTVNQINGVNTGATDFKLTGVMLSEGHLTDPEFVTFAKDFEGELSACQRYYEKSYDLATVPASLTTNGALTFSGNGGANRPYISTNLKVRKRVIGGNITFYNPRTGAAGGSPIWDTNTASTDYTVATQGVFESNFYIAPGGTPPTTSALFVHWTLDSEL